jgi:hypothetical protein
MKHPFLVFPGKVQSKFSQDRKANSTFDRLISLCVEGMIRGYDFGSLDAIGG